MTQFNVGDTVDRHDLVTIHGKYTDDHWPVDELLALAGGKRTSR